MASTVHTGAGGVGLPYWRNELTGAAQWQHPIDDFVKAAIKALRTPLHPHSSFLLTSLLGPGAMEPPE